MKKVYSIRQAQQLPLSLQEAWQFFSDPANLSLLTPAYLNLKFTNELFGPMYPGQIICYTIRPLAGIPIFWMTEITHVVDQKMFVDEQRKGPYALWHHQHHFKTVGEGTEMTDIVHYQLPLGWAGRIAHTLWVHRQLEAIFEFRSAKIRELWP